MFADFGEDKRHLLIASQPSPERLLGSEFWFPPSQETLVLGAGNSADSQESELESESESHSD